MYDQCDIIYQEIHKFMYYITLSIEGNNVLSR